MPLARIIARSVEDSWELGDDLRARGFDVETISPDQIPNTPADLEVRLEEYEPEEALNSACTIPDSQDVCVFIAPGAIAESVQPWKEPWLTPEPAPVERPVSVDQLVLTGVEKMFAEIPQAEKSAVDMGVSEHSPEPLAIRREYNSRGDQLFWKTAAAFAALGVSVLLVGATAHRLTLQPASLPVASEQTQQHTPWLGKPVPASIVSPVPAVTRLATPTVQKVSSPPVVKLQRKAKPKPQRRHRSGHAGETDMVADDLVIHYGKRTPLPRVEAQKAPGIKHYTDLN
jgi:hypothetical protein